MPKDVGKHSGLERTTLLCPKLFELRKMPLTTSVFRELVLPAKVRF